VPLSSLSAGVVAVTIALAACATQGDLPEPQAGWPTTTATLDGRELRLVVAEDHGIGMRGTSDLGGFHGMLFAYEEPVEPSAVRFSMQGVGEDLDGHFFAADGTLITTIWMAACPSDPCPSYGPDRPFRWVIEAPSGSLAVPPGARLVVTENRG
jgi:uncharacterized membrane protein (UPF0127 family)